MGQTVQLIMSGQNSTFLDSKAYHIHALMSHGYMRGGRFIYSCESYILFLTWNHLIFWPSNIINKVSKTLKEVNIIWE